MLNSHICKGVIPTNSTPVKKHGLCHSVSSIIDGMEGSNDNSFMLGKPYKWYGHPNMKLIDTIHGIVTRHLVPLHKLDRFPAVKENEMAMKLNEGFCQWLKKASISNRGSAIHKWGDLFQCPILQYEYSVPRKALLKEWGLYDKCLINQLPTHDKKIKSNFQHSSWVPTNMIHQRNQTILAVWILMNLTWWSCLWAHHL